MPQETKQIQICCRFSCVAATCVNCVYERTNEFIKMSGQCLTAWVPQNLANNRVLHQRGNATHFLCCATCVSGCHLCFICEQSYLTMYKICRNTCDCHKCLSCESALMINQPSMIRMILVVVCSFATHHHMSFINFFIGWGGRILFLLSYLI